MQLGRFLIIFCAIVVLGVALAAAPKLEIRKTESGTVAIRASGAAGKALQLEASTNLTEWSSISATNSDLLDLSETPGLSRRFFRAASPGNVQSLRFISPTNPIVTTSRPPLGVEFSGFAANESNLVLRLSGTNVAFASTISSNRAFFELLSPLPEGFVTLHVMHWPGNGTLGPTARLELTVLSTGSNLPPVAHADFRNTPVGTPVNVSMLANDRDPNGDALSVLSVTQGRNGAVSFSNGVATYTPRENFVGEDSFTYKVADNRGGTNEGVVRIAITPPTDLVAYIVDKPALPNEFRELAPALGYLCSEASKKRGKIVVRTDRVLSGGVFRINCPLELARQDERTINLSGSEVTIIAEDDLTLAGMSISAGQITFDAGGDLNLYRMALAGPSLIRLRDSQNANVADLRAAAAEVRHFNMIGFEGDAITASFEAAAAAHAKFAQGESVSLETLGILHGNGSATFEALNNETMGVKLKLESEATISVDSVTSAGLHEERLAVAGNNRLNVKSITTGKLVMDFREAGHLEAAIKDVRTQNWENKFNLRDVTHTAENTLAYDLSYTVGNEDVSVNARVTQDKAEIAGNVRVVNSSRGHLNLGLSATQVGNKLSLRGGGEFELKVGNSFSVGGAVEGEFSDGHAELDFRNGSLRGGLQANSAADARLGLVLEKVDVQADFTACGEGTASIVAGFLIDANFAPASKVRVKVGCSLPGRQHALAANTLPEGEFVVRHCEFTGASGGPPPIDLFGLRIPVRIENNTIRATPWAMVLGEIDAPLTIRSNILIAGGIGIDGDIEGEGRTGMAPGPYLVAQNTIREGHAPQAVNIQDVKYSVVENNEITAQSGIVLSAGYTIVTNNIFDASINGDVAIRTGQGPNGPAALIVSSNRFTGATPLMIMPDTYARFDANRFTSVIPTGGEETEPLSVINIGNGNGICSVVFENNELQDATINVIGARFVRFAGNVGTFREIGLQTLPISSVTTGAILENNHLSGEFPRILAAEGTSLLMHGNNVSDLDLTISGNLRSSYAIVENNTFGGASSVSSGSGGYLRLSANTFGADGQISDDGYLVNDPGSNAIDTEHISSPLDFNGDAHQCVDYPTPELTDDPADPCSNGKGPRPRSAPAISPPVELPWPVF